MKKCNSCKIEFNTSEKLCPLCQNELVGECENEVFPKNIRFTANSLILKIVLFISVVIALIVGFIEVYNMHSLKYTCYTSLGLTTNFCVIYFILKNYQNVLKMLGKYGFILIVLILIWYFVTKNTIIMDYIVTSICLLELLFNFITGLVLKRSYLVKYSNIIVMNIFLLILPSIFVALGFITNPIMAYICLIFALITIAGLFIFCFDDIKEELSKIFNV